MREAEERMASRNFVVIEGGGTDKAARERRIETRLERVSRALDRLTVSLPAALLAEHASMRRVLEELAIKLSALQWAVRIAKHSQEGVREKVWANIDESVGAMEKSLEILPRLQALEPEAEAAGASRGFRSRWHAC